MELKDYTSKELRNELKRRAAIKREEDSKKPRCRNCKHYTPDPRFNGLFATCAVRTFIRKGQEIHYGVSRSQTCDKFELNSNK